MVRLGCCHLPAAVTQLAQGRGSQARDLKGCLTSSLQFQLFNTINSPSLCLNETHPAEGLEGPSAASKPYCQAESSRIMLSEPQGSPWLAAFSSQFSPKEKHLALG